MNSKVFFLFSVLLLVTAEAYHCEFHLLSYSPKCQKKKKKKVFNLPSLYVVLKARAHVKWLSLPFA